ncbi:MAG TPA: hypothetical protein VGO73_08365 [Pyrinomonadaceae bacterium]|jgi:hypothetical protein|nr:hypothetical protein [Pyrinomonadaceae bacterium]
MDDKIIDNKITTENTEAATSRGSRWRRLGIVAAGLGLGSLLTYLFSRARGSGKEREHLTHHIVDDRGTGQKEAAQILRKLRDRAFEASDEKLAVALGRPIAEVAAWHAGQELIDDDVVMKARGIAMHRGVRVE